mmetsp:Transcript_7232/g.22124  ORF Transcript_7232/g.22124 Transcript_7232/m.22124 type:complete len:320 (+) Transcript_7232:2-961(+)
MRRAAPPPWKALVYNLKGSSVGPARAGVCAWRRKEARDALTKGALAASLVNSVVAKGLNCTESELVSVEASLADAQFLCHNLDRSLEILEANSRACDEGPEVMADYEELMREAVGCNELLLKCSRELGDARSRMWSMEYISSAVMSLFTPQTRRCCTTACRQATDRLSQEKLQGKQALHVEVLAGIGLDSSELRLGDELACDVGEDDGTCEGGHIGIRDLYAQVEFGGSTMSSALEQTIFARRNMLFAYSQETTLYVQVFERRQLTLQTLFTGDSLIGEATLLFDDRMQNGKPHMVELPIRRHGKATGTVMLNYQLITY